MKNTIAKLLAMALTASMVLTGCGGTQTTPETTEGEQPQNETEKTGDDKTGEAEKITDLIMPRLATREIETFNILFSQNAKEFENLTNLVDGLLEVDTYGALTPGIAKEWGTKDGGVTWTFKLRDDVKWVDVDGQEKADCNAWDFAAGLEWVLNFHKNDSVNTSMPIEMIKGASEYYEYTKTLSKEEAFALTAEEGSKFLEMVGMEIPDDHTLIYTCIEAKPYFDTVATYACLYPISMVQSKELGVEGVKALTNETMWYNGCYTMTDYIQGNEKIFTKNPLYWDKECELFNTVTIKMVESNDVAFQLYQTGEVDFVDLTESNLKTISEDKNHQFNSYLVEKPADKYSYQVHFNYNKLDKEGNPDTNWNMAAANEAFRKSWYYGLDLSEYYKRFNAINPMNCENNYYTMKGLIYTSEGTDYTELVRQEMGLKEPDGKTIARLDAAKAEEYKQQAIEELTALGVTFPIVVDYYISGKDQVALDGAKVLSQAFSDSLGDDYVKLNIGTFISSNRQEVINPHLHSIALNGWGADYGDPQNYLGQETYGYDNAYYSTVYSFINEVEETEATKDLIEAYKEFTRLVDEANAIHDDLDARYEAYAKAEAYMIDHAIVVPAYYNVPWCLTKINLYSRMNAMFGSVNEKMKNWETNKAGYTTEEMAKIKEAHKTK